MSYFDHAKAIESKIGEALAAESLVYTIHTKTYPATLIISQSQSPAAQMDFLASADEGGVSSADSALRFIFELDGITIRTDNRLILTDAFMTKLKGLAKKWHTAFCHAYFADRISQQGATCDTEAASDPCDADEAESADTEDTDSVEVPEIDPAAIDALADSTDDPFKDFVDEPAEQVDE